MKGVYFSYNMYLCYTYIIHHFVYIYNMLRDEFDHESLDILWVPKRVR